MAVFESDNFKMARSEEPQSVSAYTPFSSEAYNYLNDINGGVYSSNPTLVQFDLSSIANSRKFLSVEDTYLTIPITMVAQYVTAAAAGVPPSATAGQLGASHALMTLKSSSQCLVHQVELSMGGQVVSDLQPFTNIYKGFRLLSEMGAGSDLKQSAPTFGISDSGIDNPNSLCYNPVLNAAAVVGAAGPFTVSGGGLTNNRPFPVSTTAGAPYQAFQGVQNSTCINEAIARRASRVVDATGSGRNGLYGPITGSTAGASLMSSTQLASEFKPYSTVLIPNGANTAGANYMVWYDVAVLPLRFLCDVVDKCPLMKRTDMLLRLYLNTGSCCVPVQVGASGITQFYAPQSSNFTNTCPYTINYLDTGVPAGTLAIASGIFVGRAQTTSLTYTNIASCAGMGANMTAAANLGLSGAAHPMQACRAYYNLIEMDADREEQYLLANTAKSVVFEQFIYNQYNNITSGSNFSQLIASGVKSPLGCLIVPLISTSNVGVSGTGTLNFPAQYASPFDTCGGLTTSPISLTNLQVYLGGVAQLQNSLYYTFENWLQQVSSFENITGNTMDILSRGISSQPSWEANRVYYVNLSRGDPADRVTPRNIQVSFTNNSGVIMDCMIFIIYLDKITVDVRSGVVRK